MIADVQARRLARIERLKAVRLQEKVIASMNSIEYRIAKKKLHDERHYEAVVHASSSRQREIDRIENQITESLIRAGDAQRGAELATASLQKERKRDRSKAKRFATHQAQREKEALRLRHQEIEALRSQALAAQTTRQVIDEHRAMDREMAHINAESKRARVTSRRIIDGNTTQQFTQLKTLQSSVSIQERCHTHIRATIVRHAPQDAITNTSTAAAPQALRTQWNKVLREMVSQAAARKRRHIAKRHLSNTKELAHISESFAMLETVDRAGDRVHRIRNQEAVSKSLKRDQRVHQHIASDFEEQFLNNDAESLESLHAEIPTWDTVDTSRRPPPKPATPPPRPEPEYRPPAWSVAETNRLVAAVSPGIDGMRRSITHELASPETSQSDISRSEIDSLQEEEPSEYALTWDIPYFSSPPVAPPAYSRDDDDDVYKTFALHAYDKYASETDEENEPAREAIPSDRSDMSNTSSEENEMSVSDDSMQLDPKTYMHYLVSGRYDAPQPIVTASPTPSPLQIDSIDLPGASHTHMPPLLYSLTPSPSVNRGRVSADSSQFISRASSSSSVSTAVARHDVIPSFQTRSEPASPLLSPESPLRSDSTSATPDSLSPTERMHKQESFSSAVESDSLEHVSRSIEENSTSPLLPIGEVSHDEIVSIEKSQPAERLSPPTEIISAPAHRNSPIKSAQTGEVAAALSLSVDSSTTASLASSLSHSENYLPISHAKTHVSPLLSQTPLLSESSSSNSDSLSAKEGLPSRDVTPIGVVDDWFRGAPKLSADSPLVSPAASFSLRSSEESARSRATASSKSSANVKISSYRDSLSEIDLADATSKPEVQPRRAFANVPATVLSLSVDSTNAMSLTTTASTHVPSIAVATQTEASDAPSASAPLSASWEYSLPALLHDSSAPPVAPKSVLSFSLASTQTAVSDGGSSVTSSIDSMDPWRHVGLPSYQPPIATSSPLRAFGTTPSSRGLMQILSDSSPDSVDSWSLNRQLGTYKEQVQNVTSQRNAYFSGTAPVSTITLSSSSSESSQDSWSLSQPTTALLRAEGAHTSTSDQTLSAPKLSSTITLSSSSNSESSKDSWSLSRSPTIGGRAKVVVATRQSATVSPSPSPPAPAIALSSSSHDSSIDSLTENLEHSLDSLSHHSMKIISQQQPARQRYVDFVTSESQRARGAIRSEFQQTRSRLLVTSHRSSASHESVSTTLPPSSRLAPASPPPRAQASIDDLLSLSSQSTPRDSLADVLGLFLSESSADSMSGVSEHEIGESKYTSRQLDSMTLNVDSEHLSREADDMLKSFLSLSSTSDVE